MSRMSSLLFTIVLMALPADAQTTATGSVYGVAKDDSGAVVPGVVVSATSATVPGVYAATTDRAGQYRLGDLPPGTYTLSGELAGFARFVRTAITVRTGLNIEIDIAMKVGAVGETVEVRQDAPLLETRNATNAVNISGELLREIPLLERREWFGALTLAPGVTTADFAGSRQFFVHGADTTANVVQIDGADVGTASNFGVSYININTDAIDDMQIKTAGVDASSPLGFGGIVNIATASGTNQLRGTAALSLQPRRWNDSNTPGGTSSTNSQRLVDLSSGGPLVKDRLWAYGAYRYADTTTGLSRTPAQIAAIRSLVKDYQPSDSASTAHFWFGKLTAQFSPAHQLGGFYQRDINPTSVATATTVNPQRQAIGGSAAAVHLSSVWSNRLTTRVGASYNDKRREILPPGVDGPFERVYQSTIVSAGRLVGNGQLATLNSPGTTLLTQPNSKITLSFDSTLIARHGSSTHELQAGFYGERRVQGNDVTYINNGFVLEDALRTSDGAILPFHRQIIDGTQLTTFRQRGRDYAAYFQDAWRPGSRLTLNAGLRIDRLVMSDLVFNVTSQNSTEIGPRVGVNYALTADGRNVARAHWVRVHDQPGIAATIGTATLATRDLYDLNLDGTFETVFFTPATFAVTPNQILDPNLHQPFVREWGTGYSRQFGGSVSVNADFIHRVYLDRPTAVETNGKYDGNVFLGYKNESFNEIYLGTNNTWNSPVYDAFELSMAKRTTRLQAIASYVRQWRHIEGTWQPNDPASFIQPSAFANDKGIGNSTGTASAPTDANSLSGMNMFQRAVGGTQWLDHAVRMGATYTGPWALLLAANYTLQSGIWSGPIVSQVPAPDPAFGPTTVRLSNGRIVTNPLATTLRFPNATRGDGQLKTPRFQALNVRVGRRFEHGRIKFEASLDVFNLTNNGADLSFNIGANQTYNPLFGTTTFRQLPRSAQALLRTSF